MTWLVFAPGTLMRFRNGRALIHTTEATMPPFQTDQLGMIGWLAQFATPVDLATALSGLSGASYDLAQRAVSYLRQGGVLVEPTAGGQAEDALAQAHDRSRAHLATLAQDVYELSCDVSGLGPHAEAALAQSTGIGLEQRLQSVAAAINALRSELAEVRAPYLAAQLQTLSITPQSNDLKLHIGCGPYHLQDWVNIDIHPAPLATNVMWGLPFADGAVRLVYLSHMLEHLFYPNDAQPFLADIHRVLAPGGAVRIVVPDIAACIDAYRSRDAVFFAERRQHWGGRDSNPTPLEDFLAYAGAGPDPAYLFEAHKFGYDFETLERALQRAGFVQIERSAHMQSRVPEFQVDHLSETASATYGGRHYSLFVEARKADAMTHDA
ncbi:MAG: methyltransferase domain-containing protein [Luteimonas sp.]